MNFIFQSIELTYYSTSFLCKAIFDRASFNLVSTNTSDVHVYDHACLPSNGSQNQSNNHLSTWLIP